MRLRIALLLLSIATPACAQTMGSTSGAMSMINIDNPASTTSTITSVSTSNATNRVITPPTVVAPGLAAAGIETCLGSSSGGLSLMGGGLSFGSTRVDEGCTIRLLARQLFAFGLRNAAIALMCQDDRVAMAMSAAGTACPVIDEPVIHRKVAMNTAAVNPGPVAEADAHAGRPFTHAEQAWFDRASN